jgi:hypothetical protein
LLFFALSGSAFYQLATLAEPSYGILTTTITKPQIIFTAANPQPSMANNTNATVPGVKSGGAIIGQQVTQSSLDTLQENQNLAQATQNPSQITPKSECAGGFPCFSGWNVNANGLFGVLFLDSIDKHSKIHGKLFDNAINGSWTNTPTPLQSHLKKSALQLTSHLLIILVT